MVDMSAIAGMASSLKAAAEITKAMVGLRDATMIQSKVIELQGVILSAQSSALAAQSDQFTLLEQVRNLEQKIARLEKWDTEKEKYQLQEVYLGAFAYVPKADSDVAEPPRWLCTACFNNHVLSVLQATSMAGHDRPYRCPDCKNSILVSWNYNPRKPWTPGKG